MVDFPINFYSKDCENCFKLSTRELHSIMKTIAKLSLCKELFSPSLFVAGGSGKHRKLSYSEFYIIGLIKTLIKCGYSLPLSLYIISNSILENKESLQSLFTMSYIVLRSYQYSQYPIVTVTNECPSFNDYKDSPSFLTIIDLEYYNCLVSEYVESR